MIDNVGPKMLDSEHPAPFMTFTFEVAEDWKRRVPEVVHEDGTSRAQVLERRHNPRYYDLMLELEKTDRQWRRSQHLAQSPWRSDDLLANRRLEHVLRVGSGVSGDGGCTGGQGFANTRPD